MGCNRGFKMLPPAPDKCQECATAHKPDAPHNAQSLFYQFAFHGRQGRWPTWKDAVAHCAPTVRAAWEAELRKRGAWTGWEGDTPPAPDVMPAEGGTIGAVVMERAQVPAVRVTRRDKMPMPRFTCPKCKKVSHNPNDVAHRYCGACCEFFPEDRHGR